MTERKSGLPRTRSSEFGSSAHGDICDSPKHQPAIAFVGPTPSLVCGSVKPVRIGQQAERHHCSELAGETGPLEWRLLMHSPPRRQTASDYLERDTVPPGGRSTNGPLYLHGQFQISRFGCFSGSLTGQSAQLTATAVRTNGSPNFTVEMSGSRSLLTGQMMSGMSQQPVRSCTLALTPA